MEISIKQMIWNDKKLRRWAEGGGVTPYDEKMINPTSIDLRLGNSFRRLITDRRARYVWSEPEYFEEIPFDANDFILCHSMEITNIPNDATAFLYLKSSMGRRGIEHLHAGFGDAGFRGQWTFELINHFPEHRTLTAGQPIAQLILLDCHEPENPYSGHYQDQRGATIAWDIK